ncbi:hypothetical protein M8818_002189 [Zalaria obscura]|uniref:Uncharacterized protein n=1 Tax=Zalaria obscura TaxID=2024903 RepID=A0ACC3SJ69_9PEZI
MFRYRDVSGCDCRQEPRPTIMSTRNGTDEESPLLGHGSSNGKASGPPIGKRLHDHLTANISKSWGDLALLGCYIITGLLDSSAVFIWGSFVSMQTGSSNPSFPLPISLPSLLIIPPPRTTP